MVREFENEKQPETEAQATEAPATEAADAPEAVAEDVEQTPEVAEAPEATEEAEETPAREAPAEGERRRPAAARAGEVGGDADERPKRRFGRRRRVCIMCADHIKVVDYKNVNFLRRFISDRARIETRRKTSACAKHQRALARAIKRARHLALLPYTPEHIRVSQAGHR
jgi:small subunit ribosomal protein S18